MPRVFRTLTWLLVGVLAVVAVAWWLARPTSPDAFYQPPADRPARPGALLRQEAFTRGVPADAQAWRMLYTTARQDGTAAVASAIVLASRGSRSEPRPVIAWTHGTTGVVPGCAPSLLNDPFANVPALRQLIDQGWIYVATDYVGQGTAGPHPYLIGEGEARSALDAIRALRQMEGIRVGNDVVVWGHSQGGHAALWTGIAAPAYAPDVNILGVAAIAPASDLPSLIEAIHATPVGRIMSAFVLHSYAAAYPDVEVDAYVPGWKRWLASDIAGRCLAGREALFSVAEALAAGGSIFGIAPTRGSFGQRLAENTPKSPLRQPLLIAQGLADDLVRPDVQSRYVRDRCAVGEQLEYRTYAGRDHLSVVAPDSPLTRDLVQWTQDRFDKVSSSATCDREDAKQPVAAER
ncbi:MAG: alpha/beta fold hydrolase [Dechloromonas sp.]|nr:alpha/beta fold hydrolase [Dechloromonas sp.]